jgi:WD40 repeat protein/serine/threonine protein kinase
MGVVCRALQKSLRRTVAVKLIRPDLLSHELRRRFDQERSVLARLHQTNILPVFTSGEVNVEREGRTTLLQFFAMPFIPGATLLQVIRAASRFVSEGSERETSALGQFIQESTDHGDRHIEADLAKETPTQDMPAEARSTDPNADSRRVRLSQAYVRSVARCVSALARSVQYLHDAGYIHCDLKPSNVMVEADEHPWIIDFGVACEAGQANTGGTPDHMAPEQFLGRVTVQTDVWGLGEILYGLLTFTLPYPGSRRDKFKGTYDWAGYSPLNSAATGVPPDLDAIYRKCLRPDPQHRYLSAQELVDDLERFLAGHPVAARPVSYLERAVKWCRRRPGWATAAGTLILALATGVVSGIVYGRSLQTARNVAEEKRGEAERNLRGAEAFEYGWRTTTASRAFEAGRARSVVDQLLRISPQTRNGVGLYYWEWNYLMRACHADLIRYGPHSGSVRCIDASRNGQRIAVGDGTVIRAYALGDATPLRTLVGHRAQVTGVACHPHNPRLASCDADGEVIVWNSESGVIERRLDAHTLAVTVIRFSPDGDSLLTASADGTLTLWDGETLGARADLLGHTAAVNDAVLLGKGERVASVSEDKTLRVWDALLGSEVRSVALEYSAESLSVSGDGKKLAVVVPDDKVEIRSATDAELLGTAIETGQGRVTDLALSRDGRRLATGGTNTKIALWSLPDGKRTRLIIGHLDPVTAVAFADEDRLLLSASEDGTARMWGMDRSAEVAEFRGHALTVRSLAFSPDGRRLASVSDDHSVRIWDVASEQEVRKGGEQEIERAPPKPDGTPGPVRRVTTYSGHQSLVFALAWRPDGKRLATGGLDQAIRIWNPATGDELQTIETPHYVVTLAYTPDGQRIVSGGWDDVVRLWNPETGQLLMSLEGHLGHIEQVAVDRQGRWIASCGRGAGRSGPYRNGDIRIWDARTGEQLFVLTGDRGMVSSVAFHPQGTLLASGGEDQQIHLWDPATGNLVRTMSGHLGNVSSVAFSPDGLRLASCTTSSIDATLRLSRSTT